MGGRGGMRYARHPSDLAATAIRRNVGGRGSSGLFFLR